MYQSAEKRPVNEISVFIAEKNQICREVQHSFVSRDDFLISGTASSAESLLAQRRQRPLDILLLDRVLPGMHPQRLLAVFRKFYPDKKIIVTVLNSRAGKLAQKYGVDGCLQKCISPADFALSNQDEIENREYLSPTRNPGGF